ncbi:ABC transporter permease [Streptococcus sp. zg-86]|uniref:ABC transporter permease n=1 Tax=Streptococcus zhangguiae TaxID=2664091 RepID=A0A6I4RIB7_9STRE|nr:MULTISPECIES: ABC transporter permease [unclassified Streptococcus]MTB64560.1 ABC transporter permease [Streptococcus sp. zg-86]MTB90750.1 ABC transporter permease [Streptococcus sp. zg-36]MWV56547.1 ABC transporter permease [Streptococcus sp. zg-70]QTH47248.1 ABC transporter permease [Streptococcus sp. zg-86]
MNYLKADLYRILKERKLILSLSILIALSLLSAFLLSSSPSKEDSYSLIQLLTQFLPLFFLAPTNLLFGEDFHHRTINNLIVKKQKRNAIFLYKILTNLVINLLYILFAYTLALLMRILLGGEVDITTSRSIFIHQLPLYICIILLSSTLFIAFKKINQSYLSFILIVLLFDNVLHLITNNLLHISIPNDIFLFRALQNMDTNWTASTIIACFFTIIYLISSYHLFKKKELK